MEYTSKIQAQSLALDYEAHSAFYQQIEQINFFLSSFPVRLF